MWNYKSVIVNRIYLTLLGLFSLIAVFGIYLAIHAVSNFLDDKRVVEAQLKVQQDSKSQFWHQTNGRKVDKWTDEELRFYLGELDRADARIGCLETLLAAVSENYDSKCPGWVREELYPKVKGGLYNAGRFDYYQLIFPALMFTPLILLVLARVWFLWVFVDNNKTSSARNVR